MDEITVDGVVFRRDPNSVVDSIASYMTLEAVNASFDSEFTQFPVSAALARNVVENARSALIDFFEHYYFIDGSNYAKNLILAKTEEELKSQIDVCKKELKKENEIMGKKGLFADRIKNIIEDMVIYNNDLYFLSKDLFFYILTKINNILYSTNKNYKKFIDSILELQKYGLCMEIDKKYLDRRYSKHKKHVNDSLKLLSKFRNMKLGTKINRNSFLVVIDESIKYTLENTKINPIMPLR